MITLFVQILISLCLSTIIATLFSSWLNKRARKRAQAYHDTLFEIIPLSAVSHYDRNVVEPKPPAEADIKTSQFIR